MVLGFLVRRKDKNPVKKSVKQRIHDCHIRDTTSLPIYDDLAT